MRVQILNPDTEKAAHLPRAALLNLDEQTASTLKEKLRSISQRVIKYQQYIYHDM